MTPGIRLTQSKLESFSLPQNDAKRKITHAATTQLTKKQKQETPKELKAKVVSSDDSDDDELLDALLGIKDLEYSDEDTLQIEPSPPPKKQLSRLKRGYRSARKITYTLSQLKGSNISFAVSPYSEVDPIDESDSEMESLEESPDFSKKVIKMGIRVKFLANVYLQKVDRTANVFLPYYTLNGKSDYFRTPKDEICVFASGGLQNVWEKTVSYVFKCFFNQKIKIIRASWIQKYGVYTGLEKEYEGREKELHSELYYDLFFRYFFLPIVKETDSLKIHAYSFWQVCDSCEELLSDHSKEVPNLTYHVAASRRYSHDYPSNTVVSLARVPQSKEKSIWQEVWSSILIYARKRFVSKKAKHRFWTQTKEGLEVCKWMGQAFVENQVSPKEKKAKPLSRGDVLGYYANVTKKESIELKGLLEYLRKVNWDLSCWYKPPRYPSPVQRQWKRYWRQLVIPHFDWERVLEHNPKKVEISEATCEMCGYSDLKKVYLIFHPKFRVSESFLNKPLKYQETSGEPFLDKTFQNVPLAIQEKREQSLCVGSECVKTLLLDKEDLKDWRKKNPLKKEEERFSRINEREEQNEKIDNLVRLLQKKH